MASTYEITYAERAIGDAEEIYQSIGNITWKRSAEKWLTRIFDTAEALTLFPEGCAKCIFNDRYRCAKVGKYVIIYRVDKTRHQVRIIRIVYARRDLAAVKLRFFSI